MIKRYSDQRITEIWSLERKFELWQKVELAVIEGRELLNKIPSCTLIRIEAILKPHPIDIAFIDQREKILQHDLNAFLEERQRFLPPDFQAEFHKKMTSYDTEEAPFAIRLKLSCDAVLLDSSVLLGVIRRQALAYRYTPMNARTHGQEAEMQSFGKRCLTWYQDMKAAVDSLKDSMKNLVFSKLSGAIGTNSGIEPELEGRPEDPRLQAVMPHKKNTILTENTKGMARMACQYAAGIKENIATWEERDIAQSSVERVFWPDLFHVTLQAVRKMTRVMKDLVVYPDTMLIEIIESRGCYASNEAKEVLLELGGPFGLTREDAYRIVQLACFNAFEPNRERMNLRKNPFASLADADRALEALTLEMCEPLEERVSIEEIIAQATLHFSDQLAADEKTVAGWNEKLKLIFDPSHDNYEKWDRWNLIFKPSHILTNEGHLFKQVFDV